MIKKKLKQLLRDLDHLTPQEIHDTLASIRAYVHYHFIRTENERKKFASQGGKASKKLGVAFHNEIKRNK